MEETAMVADDPVDAVVESSSPVTVGVIGDGEVGPTPQILASLSEVKAMRIMPGGLCLLNWLRIRGLIDEPFAES